VDCLSDPSSVELIVMECDADFGSVNFFFGGEDFALTANELLQPFEDFGLENPSSAADPLCLFGMAGQDLVDTWVLGDPFLRNFYTAYNVFDKTVGIAPATSKRAGDECKEDAALGSPTSPGADDGDESAEDDDHGLDAASAPVDSASSSTGGHAEGAGTAGKESTSLMSIGVAASLGTMVLLGCGLAVLVARQRWKRLGSGGAYRSTIGGGGGGGGGGAFEMSWTESKGMSSSSAA
ncbi:unnamed protein product, partial [Hapterophycus canaliculatus]